MGGGRRRGGRFNVKIRNSDKMNERDSVDSTVRTEEHSVRGDGLVAIVKEVIHEGNIRRISIKNAEGKTLIEIPLTIGVVGLAFAPVLAAIGALAALAADFTLVVEKKDE